ncbi:MAG: D-Ala-D-Ala carboxypeptidase family metallohydrolase [Ruminococcus sp.]|nr:D-Ala-D-Ala carboxypeptidase family metallohydrolase [Ruminococcus sp.]
MKSCGKTHDTELNPKLVDNLEKLYRVLDCSKIVVTSGYRCPDHDKAVGGNGTGQHTKGNAADIICYGKDGSIISTKKVACKAQDIGFRGIGNIDSTYTAIHVDVRTGAKWYGDEAVRGGTSGSVTDDFYRYYSTKDNSTAELQKILNDKGAALDVDGIAGTKTLSECHKYTINDGDSGELTRWVQARLNAIGFNCGAADGIAGERTMTAIYNFQQAHKLGIGYLGGSDWDALLKK